MDIARIPTIDIINLPTNPSANGTFGHYWHTHKDNMNIIDKHSLGAVGEVLIQVLYKKRKWCPYKKATYTFRFPTNYLYIEPLDLFFL